MTMTNEEIIRDYSQARNKTAQIKILADLNTCSPSEIKKVLAEAGVSGVKMPERIRPRRSGPQESAREPEAKSSAPAPAFWDRVETILAALPEDISGNAAACVQNLLQTLFAEYLEQRLMGRQCGETDEHN